MCLSDVQSPQVTMTPYTAAFMMQRTRMFAGGNKMTSFCPQFILWYIKPSIIHRYKIWSVVWHNLHHHSRWERALPFLCSVFCVNAVQKSIVSGLEERERERNADALQDTTDACESVIPLHDDDPTFSWFNLRRWSVHCPKWSWARAKQRSTRNWTSTFY